MVYADLDLMKGHVATANLFRNGRSQAVRLPKEFRLRIEDWA